MKRVLFFAASWLFIGLTGLALAQDATPVAGHPAGQSAMKWDNPRFAEIHQRMRNQRERIAAGLKSGKLTQDQAKTLENKVEAVRGQMRSDFQQNKQSGQKGLTDEQFQQLNQMLDDSSLAIFGDKHGDSSATSTNP
jgi:hypothetical protein